MPYTLFYEKFPTIAEEETRSIILMNDPELPSGKYTLIESYCNESNCDCRRVFLSVLSEKQKKIMAVIAFGWESERYYSKWMGDSNPEALKEMKGPTLNLGSPQSRLAPKILELVDKVALQDKKYIKRLKRHYDLFRKEIGKRVQDNKDNEKTNVVPFSTKIGRNMPCPCGSGKKYKKCCLNIG